MESPAETIWKGYSLAERDRRWQTVRENAAVVIPTEGGKPLFQHAHGLIFIS